MEMREESELLPGMWATRAPLTAKANLFRARETYA
jgi:hypothetical protein